MNSSSFEIIGNGVSLDVANGSKLTTEFVATTFNESAVFAGSYSYPITFPLTAKNIDFFEHSHHLENRGARKDKEVIICFFGMPWKTAVISYEISSKGYEASLKVDNGAVADWMRETTLSDVFSSENKGKITHQSIVLGEDEAAVQSHILSNRNPTLGYVWPSYLNSNATGVLKSGDEALINDFNNMTALSDTKLYSPWFYHVWMIRKVCEWMGYKAVGSYLEEQFVQSLIIYNTGLRTGADWKVQKKINPAEHLPKVTIAEYFKNIRNDHRVMIYFDSLKKIAYFETCDTLLSSDNRLDLTESIHFDSLEIKARNDQAFKLLTKIDDNDELYSNVQYEKSVMVGYDFAKWKELPLGIGRLHMSSGVTIKSVANSVLPVVQQIANIYSESFNTEEHESVYNGGNVISKNEFVLRMMSYKGLQSLGSSTHQVPFCTGDNKGNNGTVYSNSLDHGGAVGIVNQFTLQYYRFYCTSELVNVVTEMNVLDFYNMHPLQKMLIQDRNQGKVEVLMDKVVFEPHSKYNVLGKISCYPNYDLLGSAQGMKVLVGNAVIENTEGVIYAKLFTRVIRSVPQQGLPHLQTSVITLEFYADAAGLIPYSANELPYKIVFNRYRWNHNREVGYYWTNEGVIREETGIANGSSYVHGEYYNGGLWDQDQAWPFLEQNGENITVLGNYRWIYTYWRSY